MFYIYTTVQHVPRKLLQLDLNEYAVLDILFKTQTHPTEGKNGFTDLGCHAIGFALGLSPATILRILNAMSKRGFLEFKDSKKRLKRVTEAFYKIAYEANVQKLNVQKLNEGRSETEHSDVQKLNENRSETEQHYNKEEDLKKKRNKEFIVPSLDELKILFKDSLTIHLEGNEENISLILDPITKEFLAHNLANDWTNSKGNKIKSLKGAVNTWTSNAKNWGWIRKKLAELKPTSVQTTLFEDDRNKSGIKYDRNLDDKISYDLERPNLKTV